MTESECEAWAPGFTSWIRVETRRDSLAFKKPRSCPQCQGTLTPFQIKQSENWVERCSVCESYWLDRIDQRQFQNFVNLNRREARFATLPESTQREFQTALAESAIAFAPEEDISPRQQVLCALGIPVLAGVSRDRTPVMTVLLVALLTCLFFGFHAEEIFPLAFLPSNSWLSAFSANFVHANVSHWLGNAVFLLVFGNAVEQMAKRRWLLLAFLVAGPISIWAEAVTADRETLILGASGAISFLVGMAGFLHPQARFWFHLGGPLLLLRVVAWKPLSIPIVGFVALQILWNLLLLGLGVSGVAFVSHLTGLFLGAAVGWLAKRPSLKPFVIAEDNL